MRRGKDPGPTEARIVALLSAGPMSAPSIAVALGMSRSGTHCRLMLMEQMGRVRRFKESPPKPGRPLDLWEACEFVACDVDLPMRKRARGFGTNPPGQELVKAWG